MIDETLKKVRHLYDLTNEDMDPIDAQIGDLTNHDFFEELIDPGSKLLEMVSREVDKNIHWKSAECKNPSFHVPLHHRLQ